MARGPSRGYRLYELQLFLGQRQDPQPFVSKDQNYLEHVRDIIDAHLLGKRLEGPPRLNAFTHADGPGGDDASEEEDVSRIFEVHDVREQDQRLWVTYRSGGVGNYRWAVPRGGGDPVDVSEHAVTNEQRACLLIPPRDATVGLLVAESAGRANGETTLQRWLHAASKAYLNNGSYFRLRLKAVADPAHVAELVDEQSVQEVVLQRRQEQPDRSTTTEPFTIRAPLKTEYSRRRTVETLRGWVGQRENPLSVREGARQLAAIIDPQFADVIFDDGYVKAKGDNDSGQQLRPDLAKDIFTYKLGPGWSSDSAVLREARTTAEGIHGLSELELPWP